MCIVNFCCSLYNTNKISLRSAALEIFALRFSSDEYMCMCRSNASAPPIIWINANTFVYICFGNPKVRSAALSAAVDLTLGCITHSRPKEAGCCVSLGPRTLLVHTRSCFASSSLTECVTELARKKVTIPRDPFSSECWMILSPRRCHYAIMVNLWSRDAHAISFAVQSTQKNVPLPAAGGR